MRRTLGSVPNSRYERSSGGYGVKRGSMVQTTNGTAIVDTPPEAIRSAHSHKVMGLQMKP